MTGYSRSQIVLHWLIAVLIVAAWLTHEEMGEALKARLAGSDVRPPHVPLGIAVFALVALRLMFRRLHGVPAPVDGTSRAMEAAALWGHRLLYLLMIAAPALGIATWFGGIRSLGEAHETVGNALILVALGHALVAIWHQTVLRDGILARMLRP